jgi:hypothetical protein
MNNGVVIAILTLGILAMVDHYLNYDKYTDVVRLMLREIARSFGF